MAVLCSFVMGCTDNDTAERKEWPDCPDISSREQAVKLLPACTDKAIAALEGFADRDPIAMSELAAAYYVRAKRQDKPADLLKAFDAAEQAVAERPQSKEAQANLARIENALAMTAQERGEEWVPERLAVALRANDAKIVARLIKPYPASAQHFLEEELLPQNVPQARLLAAQIARITGDRFVTDEVEACSVSDGAKLQALRAGYAAYSRVRAGGITEDANTAASELRRGGSPLHLYADVVRARDANDYAGLDAVEQEARDRHYPGLAAWIVANRALLYFYDSNHGSLQSLAGFDAALTMYAQLHDAESAAIVQVRHIGVLRVAGQSDAAWRQALRSTLAIHQLTSSRDQTLLFAATAAAAFALGHPEAAFRYQDISVRQLQGELKTTPPERVSTIGTLQHNLGIARRWRAVYELHTERLDAAREDLQEAVHLTQNDSNPEFRRSLDARNAEVQAQLLMRTDVNRAADAFTTAITLSKDLEYPSFRAFLYAQRAEANRLAHKPAEFELDLRASLAELNAEETKLLENRKTDNDATLVWNGYFSRFQDTYRLLIRQLIETNRGGEAFAYADRARAYEPLNLALKLTPTDASTVDIAGIRKYLPPGSFLIEYTILDDRTYAWVVSHDRSQVLTLPAGRTRIKRWSDRLQQSVPARDLGLLDATLLAAYDNLVAGPMAAIAAMPDSGKPRLIFVPDSGMDAIPFAALRNPVSRRYLVQDATVSMAGSAALYAFSVRRDHELAPDRSALLIGDPRTSLPHAGSEVKQIAQFYTPLATVRTGAEATADDFLQRAGDNAIVHIAAHAVIDPLNPPHSSLLFATGELDAATLLDRLKPGRTRLVVLGACSSAGGLPVGPEGVGPLVRPLIARGVPAVVGALSAVNDATAEPLLVSFHQHYKEGNDAAAAMQLAQLDLLRNQSDVLQSVLAWAPFQVIGYGSSPFAAPRK